jgi:excisionase family DNA binding protein
MHAAAEQPHDDREWISIREAARLSGLGRTTIYGLLARKAIESTKVGKRRLVRRRAISELGKH